MLILQEVLNELISLRDYLRYCVSELIRAEVYFGHGTDNAWDEALALLLPTLHLPMDSGELMLDARLTMDERKLILTRIKQRVQKRVPVAYMTHQAYFAGLKFYVNEHVLVPRSPLAELIERQFAPWVHPENVSHILDLCTGSGCIAIASAMAFPDASVDGVDISTKALSVAKRNIKHHHLDDRVRAFHSDLFSKCKQNRYDLIISNPPYVDKDDLASMPDEFHHEPIIGLAAGEDGLDFVIPILAHAANYLNDEGVLIVEVGNSQYALQDKFPEVPFVWLEFERGGDGVFALTKAQLAQFAKIFSHA